MPRGPPRRVVLEIDSYEYHGDRISFSAQDRDRDAARAAEGDLPLRITAGTGSPRPRPGRLRRIRLGADRARLTCAGDSLVVRR